MIDKNAACVSCTRPTMRIRFLPSFCFCSNFCFLNKAATPETGRLTTLLATTGPPTAKDAPSETKLGGSVFSCYPSQDIFCCHHQHSTPQPACSISPLESYSIVLPLHYRYFRPRLACRCLLLPPTWLARGGQARWRLRSGPNWAGARLH